VVTLLLPFQEPEMRAEFPQSGRLSAGVKRYFPDALEQAAGLTMVLELPEGVREADERFLLFGLSAEAAGLFKPHASPQAFAEAAMRVRGLPRNHPATQDRNPGAAHHCPLRRHQRAEAAGDLLKQYIYY
jgi:hypothetical protein